MILDEAHRARRRSARTLSPGAKGNNLLEFLRRVSPRTKSLLLATATPVQLHPIEAFDLLDALARGFRRSARLRRQSLAPARAIPRPTARSPTVTDRLPRALGLATQSPAGRFRRSGFRAPPPHDQPAGRCRLCGRQAAGRVAGHQTDSASKTDSSVCSSTTTRTSAPSSCVPASNSKVPSTRRPGEPYLARVEEFGLRGESPEGRDQVAAVLT